MSTKRSWRKLHIAVDNDYFIQSAELTTRLNADETVVDDMIHQIYFEVNQITADGVYDKNHVFDSLSIKFTKAEIFIPPDSDSVFNINNHPQQNRNYQEMKTFSRMAWQKVREYGNRNKSELSIQRYKKILGNQS